MPAACSLACMKDLEVHGKAKRASQNIAAKNKLERYNKGTPLFGCSTEGKKPIYLLIPVRNKDEVLYVRFSERIP